VSILNRSRKLVPHLLAFVLFSACLGWPADVPAPARSRRPLAQRIEAILRSSEARRGHWGIEVVRLKDGKVLYARNAEQLFLPASNMKLFTTAAALEKLGPDFRFRTTVESDAAPDAAGRVGDLLLVGRGDPTLGPRVIPGQPQPANAAPAEAIFEELAGQVAARGVREVGGNLVADDSHFLYEPYSHGWEEEDLVFGYAAPVTALAFNDNALRIRFAPGAKAGERARVTLEPLPDYYQLNNRLETAPAGTRAQIFLERAPGSNQLDVWGEIAVDAEAQEDAVALANPPQLAGELFRRALEARGIVVRGPVEVRHSTRIEAAAVSDPPLPARVVLAEHLSEPLARDIEIINKYSHNLHAEMLLRTLGREAKNYGSLTRGLQALEEFAAAAGIEKDESIFTDGAGLSRHTLVAPHALIKLLRHMAASPRFEAFLASLPVAGEDGTLAERFRGTRARGRIRAKTGTMENVNALSGYMELPSGERLAFSIIGNSHPLKSAAGRDVVDRIALEILQQFSRRPGKAR
jgi:D-alanyl-D-alanine carboxypeptidase/D-alanyl-D-alanine-endopeptidase (penicillin-binding protein 4)